MNEAFAIASARLVEDAPRILSTALRHGGDLAEIFSEFTSIENVALTYRAGRKSGRRSRQEIVGTGARLLDGVSERFRYVESLDPTEIAKAFNNILSSSPNPRAHPSRTLCIPPGISEQEALLEAASDAAFSLEPELSHLDVRLRMRAQDALIAANDAGPALSTSRQVGIRVEAGLAANGRHITANAVGGGAGGLEVFFDRTPESIARECIERLHTIRNAASDVEGELPVVIAGGWGGAWLHEAVGHLLEADVAETGPFNTATIGEGVAADGVTIVDDPTIPRARASRAIDDEGHPASRTVLIEGGILRGLMTDRLRARQLGLPRTANGLRQDFRHAPLPRMTNLVLQNGSQRPEQLIGSILSGLFVKMIANGRVYPAENRFSFDVVEGYRIANGRLERPVTGLRIHGRSSEILHRLEGIADDLLFDSGRGVCLKKGQRVDVAVGTPTVLISRLRAVPIPM